jgi:hypothetical protein
MYSTFIFFVEQIFILPTSSVTLDCYVQGVSFAIGPKVFLITFKVIDVI